MFMFICFVECDSGIELGVCGWFYLIEFEKYFFGCIVVFKLEVVVVYVEVNIYVYLFVFLVVYVFFISF